MDAVLTSVSGGVCEITLNRPKYLNALNFDLIGNLTETIDMIESDRSIKCAVIKGAGDHFMAGGDITYFKTLMDLDDETKKEKFSGLIEDVHVFVERMANMEVPVIASVRGAAAGFGISLVSGCDLAIASETSFFTSAYNFLGTSPDGGSTFYLPRSVGMKKTMELVLLSERIGPETAMQIGLVNRVVKDADLEQATEEVAKRIVKSARMATANAKFLVRNSFENDLSGQLNLELDKFLECALTDDFREGVDAFLTKRKPDFQS